MRLLLFFVAVWLAAPLASRADDLLTPSQIETLEKRGWITPDFEAASRRLLDALDQAEMAKQEQATLDAAMPALQKKVDAEDGKVAVLRNELTHYDHPEETDFAALQAALKDSSAPLADQTALAQAYVWTYPGGPHVAEAETILRRLEKKVADEVQAARDDAAAQETAHLKLQRRVKAHDLSLAEWRSFLQDKSQDEVRQELGAPTGQSGDYWTYAGAWTVDPASNLKAGLQLTFNGGRVLNVAPIPVP